MKPSRPFAMKLLRKAPPEYEGFNAPKTEASSAAAAPAPAVQISEAAPAVQEVKADDSDASDADDDAADDSAPVKRPVRPPGRRTGVSAEASKGDADDWVPPVYEKTPEERASLSNIIKSSRDSKIHMLFGTVNQDSSGREGLLYHYHIIIIRSSNC